MSSTSTATGEYSLNVQFNLEKNADIAAVEVQNRVSQATSSMPQEVTAYGITTTKELRKPSCISHLPRLTILMTVCFLRTYADVNFIDAVKRVKGVSHR